MCEPTGVKANGLTGKFAMAMPVGFFEDSGLGAGGAGAEEKEEADETGETESDWAPRAVELTAAMGGGIRSVKQWGKDTSSLHGIFCCTFHNKPLLLPCLSRLPPW